MPPTPGTTWSINEFVNNSYWGGDNGGNFTNAKFCISSSAYNYSLNFYHYYTGATKWNGISSKLNIDYSPIMNSDVKAIFIMSFKYSSLGRCVPVINGEEVGNPSLSDLDKDWDYCYIYLNPSYYYDIDEEPSLMSIITHEIGHAKIST